jgi:hypothetical protein
MSRLERRRRGARSQWITITAVCLGAGALFAVVGGISFGYTPRMLIFLGVSGVLLGAIGAPEIEPRAFRRPVLWQTGCGVVGGLLTAVSFGASLPGLLLGVVIGGVVGALARYWIGHVQLP